MIAISTPKPVSIIGSFGVALVFTLGFNHVRDGVNDWFVEEVVHFFRIAKGYGLPAFVKK